MTTCDNKLESKHLIFPAVITREPHKNAKANGPKFVEKLQTVEPQCLTLRDSY